jgi:Holliday junction resolvasome RuvABC ATP-dependent DNA helicase subunit
MTLSTHALLTEITDRYQQAGEPVAVQELCESLDVPESAIEDSLDSLCEFELLERTDSGCRPTVTARELLALEIDPDEVLVLDFVDAEGEPETE